MPSAQNFSVLAGLEICCSSICCNSFAESIRCDKPSEVPDSKCNGDRVINVWTQLLYVGARRCGCFVG